MFSHYCANCHRIVSEYCPEHPAAQVQSLWHPSISDLRRLAQEALQAGDTKQAELCELAIAGDFSATTECSRVILAARAMQEGTP